MPILWGIPVEVGFEICNVLIGSPHVIILSYDGEEKEHGILDPLSETCTQIKEEISTFVKHLLKLEECKISDKNTYLVQDPFLGNM